MTRAGAGGRAPSAGPTSGAPPAVLAAHEVGFAYRGGRPVLEDVSVTVTAGRGLALVGESGAGKTTLLRLLLGLDRPTSGRVLFDGAAVAPGDRAFRRAVQPVFQDPYSSLDPRRRVGRIVSEPLRSLGLLAPGSRAERRDEAGRRVAEALASVGLPPDAAQRYPHEFSGGQRQRIAIARAVVSRPRVLLADEPVSALDVTTRIRVVELLGRLAESHGLTVVVVSHDLSVVAALCADTAIIERGRVVEQGPTADVLGSPAHPYTRKLLESVPRLSRAARLR